MSGISLPYIVEPSTAIGLTNINPNEVLGNVSSASAIPIGITQSQLTSLINLVSSSAKGAMIALSGVSTSYFAGDGSYQPFPVIPTPPPQDFVLLNTQSGTNVSQLAFTSTSIDGSYEIYQFHLAAVRPVSGSIDLKMQISTNGGATWISSAGTYETVQHGITNDGIYLTNNQIIPAGGYTGVVEYPSLGISGTNIVAATNGTALISGQAQATAGGGCLLGVAATINAVRFLADGGGNISGSVRLYGING